jgi:hypothetical protein
VVDMSRREREEAEMMRLRNRARHGEGMAAGLGGREDLERRRRRPREDLGLDYERRHERRDARRRAGLQPFPPAHRFVERAERRPKGFRAFINNAIDATEILLFGSPLRRLR